MKKSLLLIFLAAIVLAGCTSKNSTANLESQKSCAEMAQKFVTEHQDNSPWFTFTSTNHFNSKQNKCFVLEQASNPDGDYLSFDLYDALEGKHYAMFVGHSICDSTTLAITNEPKKCQLDWGVVWLNGDDTWTPDVRVGFVWAANWAGMWDENTQKQFMEAIKSFMND